MCHHTLSGLLIAELRDSVESTSKLEGSDFLLMLTLKEDTAASQIVDRPTRHDRSSMRDPSEASRGVLNVLKSERHRTVSRDEIDNACDELSADNVGR